MTDAIFDLIQELSGISVPEGYVLSHAAYDVIACISVALVALLVTYLFWLVFWIVRRIIRGTLGGD